jgi:thiamine-phosphate pyrophosphorylase
MSGCSGTGLHARLGTGKRQFGDAADRLAPDRRVDLALRLTTSVTIPMLDPNPSRPAWQADAAGLWRALDASANRAAEALRVLEDVVRFVLDDARLTGLAKDLRHALATVLAQDSLRGRVVARDVAGDVGVGLEPEVSPGRRAVDDLVAANAARAAQALRSLAECAAVVAPPAAADFERIRYRLYALEQAALTAARARDRLREVSLCVLVDGGRDIDAFDRLVATLLDAGVRMLQVRDKRLAMPAIADRTARTLAIARRRAEAAAALVIVNDRADVAVAVGADGVHVGATDLPTALARRVIGPQGLVGRTAHTVAEAVAAAADGADYLGIGPCFPSATKRFDRFATEEFLRGVVREISLPAFAIGGITLDRIDALAALGVSRVAVASAVTAAADPGGAAAAFIARLAALGPASP